MSLHYDIAQILIKEGADVHVTDSHGNSPLVLVISQCIIPPYPEKNNSKDDFNNLVQALINAGADLQATNNIGYTVYEIAGMSKCLEMQETLQKAGAKMIKPRK